MKITIYQKVQTVIQIEFPDDDAAVHTAQHPTKPRDAFQNFLDKSLEKTQQEQRFGKKSQIWKEENYVALLP